MRKSFLLLASLLVALFVVVLFSGCETYRDPLMGYRTVQDYLDNNTDFLTNYLSENELIVTDYVTAHPECIDDYINERINEYVRDNAAEIASEYVQTHNYEVPVYGP